MKLSIITINWNNREGLNKTIKSVLGQSVRKSFEYIVVDGASSDGSAIVLKDYGQDIDNWISEKDTGIYNAMNKGVSMAIGDYCLFLNSGDILHGSDAIKDVLGHLNGEDLVIGKMIFLATGLLMQASDPITLLSLFENSIPHNATFIRRDLLIKYPYDERLRIVSDWKFFVQALILGNASYHLIDTIVSEFDCNGISSKNRDLCEQERDLVLRELFPGRILLDYNRFLKGSQYKDTTYDRFYHKLQKYKSGAFLYSLNVFFLRILSLFKKSARWARTVPIRLH